ncbi:uncharacterized protein LOC123684425 [Harmonia axyridis]|uniref:uncharacterized protein LOC123684425 n=1 Tax=Harmonia axyridis TaxID=115357 RepID=UPI001E277F74|nr:uncharacterized protein LOC123684425 [Harmonia axyridis]
MLILIVTFSIFSSSSAIPGYHSGGHKLRTVPEGASYGKIQYPHFDIIDLGDYRKNGLPPKYIHVNKKIVIKEPKPYHVKVPHHVPYPVIQKVPYPVVNKEIVKVPQPIPYPVLKTVHIPVEVPKPYPVSSHEYEEKTVHIPVEVPKPYPVSSHEYEGKNVHIPVEVPKPYPVPLHEYEESSSSVGQTGYGSETPDTNLVDSHQNDAKSFVHEDNYDKGPWKPVDLDQYRKLNEYIQHQVSQGGDILKQHDPEERPVYEDNQDHYSS